MSDTDAQKSKIFLPITNLRNIAQLRKNINDMKSTEIRGNTYSITINEYYPQQRASELIRMIKTSINVFQQRIFCLIGDEKELLLLLRHVFKHIVFANRVKLCNMEYQKNKCIVFHVTERCSYNKLMDGIYAWISGILDPNEQKCVIFLLSKHEPIQEYQFDAHYKYLFLNNVLTYNCRQINMDIQIERIDKGGIIIKELVPIEEKFPNSPTLPELPIGNNEIMNNDVNNTNNGIKHDTNNNTTSYNYKQISFNNKQTVPKESGLLPSIDNVQNIENNQNERYDSFISGNNDDSCDHYTV